MPFSKKSHESYLMIDHRASPGMPAEVLRQAGFDVLPVGEGKLFETATLTCSHCRTIVIVNPLRTRERPYCPKCDHYVCDNCAVAMRHADYVHTPFEKFADDYREQVTKGSSSLILLGSK